MLDPLASSSASPQTLEETYRATLNIGSIVLAHDWLDGLGRFIGIVEGDGGNVMMEDMSFDDTVEEGSADEAKLAVNCCSRPAGKVP